MNHRFELDPDKRGAFGAALRPTSSARTIPLTEHQFEELRTYEDGNPSWRPRRPNANLIRRNLLTLAPRAEGFYQITAYGRDALRSFREKYGLKEES